MHKSLYSNSKSNIQKSMLLVIPLVLGLMVLLNSVGGASPGSWHVEETEHGVLFSSGSFQFEIDSRIGTIRHVRSDGKSLVLDNTKPLLAATLIESREYDLYTDFIADARELEAVYTAEHVEYAVEGDKLKIIFNGSLTFPEADALNFRLQVSAQAGEHVLHTDIDLDKSGEFVHRYLRRVSMQLPLNVNYRKRIAQGGDQGFTWDTRYFYQYHLDTTRRMLIDPDRNEWRLFGIDQTSPVSYQLWRSESEKTAPLVMQQGVNAAGWSSVYDQEGGVLFAYQDLQAHAPKAVRVNAWDRGELVVMLYPDSVRAISPHSPVAYDKLFGPTHSIDLLFFKGEYAEVNPTARLASLWGVDSLVSDPPYSPHEKFMLSHDEWLPEEMTRQELSPWITGGVALPRGQVTDPNGVLLFHEGRELSYQSQPLAYWPDGSIKWLLLTFREDVEASSSRSEPNTCCEPIPFDVTMRDGSKREYSLRYATAPVHHSGSVAVVEREDSISVDTGPLQIEVVRGTHWIRQVTLNGEVIVQTDESMEPIAFVDFLRTDEAYETMTTHPEGTLDAGPVVINRIDVESAGPHRAVLRLEGKAQSRESADVIIRLEAYGGQSFIRMNHSVEFTHQDPREVFLRQMGIRLPILLDEAEQEVFLGGEQTPTNLTEWQVAGLRQLTHTEYAHWRITDGENGREYEEVEQNNRSLGWLDVFDGRRGVMVAMRNMWQYAPNELVASRDDSTLTAFFWPATAPLMDVRRYSDYPHRSQGESVGNTPNDWVETSYYGNDPFVGVSRSHEVLWFFHDSAVEGEQLGAVAADFQSPPLVFMGDEWYRRSGVVLPEPDPELFPRVSANRDNVINFWLYHQKLFGWYGKWYYGDIQHQFNSGYGTILPANLLKGQLTGPDHIRSGDEQRGSRRDYDPQHHWAFDNGRWGWTNTEGLPGMFFQREYMRTGDREFYFLAEASARYARDVVIRHSGKWFGRGTRHGVQPWSDGNHEERQTVHSEFRFHHYLSGDMRSRDVAQKLLKAHYLISSVSKHASHSGRLYGLLTSWEMTGDPELADVLKRYVHTFIVPDGIAGSPNVSFPRVTVGGHDDVNTVSMFFHVFGGMHALIEYYYLTHDEELRRGLVRMAGALMPTLPTRPGATNSSWKAIAFAAQHADDPKPFRDFLMKWFQDEAWMYAFRSVSSTPQHWAGPTAFLQPGVPSIHFWINSLPYLMTAFDKEPEIGAREVVQMEYLDRAGDPSPPMALSWQSEYDQPEFDQFLGTWRPWSDSMRVVLPESMYDGVRLQGIVPLTVQVAPPGDRKTTLPLSDSDGIEEVQILVNDVLIYSGTKLPAEGDLDLNTRELPDGRHELTIVVSHEQFGRVVESISFQTLNWWRVADELRPPVSTFLGTIDRLNVDHKSDGWEHKEDQPEAFFGDETRLVRKDDTAEFLVWSTPSLKEVDVSLFARGVDIEKGVVLATSFDADEWTNVPYDSDSLEVVVVETSEEGWQSIELRLTVTEDVNWFRLSIGESLPAHSVQVGRVEMRGWQTE